MQYTNILTPSIEKRREIDLIPDYIRTWEEKMIDKISRSETIDEDYFKSDNGEFFCIGDKKIKCFILEPQENNTQKVYRSTNVKASDIGILYDLIEDEFSNRGSGNIVLKKIIKSEKRLELEEKLKKIQEEKGFCIKYQKYEQASVVKDKEMKILDELDNLNE